MTADSISVVIVDDHKLVREGLKVFIRPIPDIVIIGEAQDGLEAIELARRTNPDVILMDLVMPRVDGIEAAQSICQQNPQAHILMITSFTEDERVMAAIQAGASGYLLKDSSPEELERAIRLVAQGQSYLPANIARTVIQHFSQPGPKVDPREVLTDRETEILSKVGQGLTNEEIAQALYLSPWTVRSHIWRITKKLNLENRTQVALYAVRQ